MKRRRFFAFLGICVPLSLTSPIPRAAASGKTLLTVPVELGGDWGGSARRDVAVVIERMRTACLAGVALRSDRQPEFLRVEHRPGNHPSIWLQTTAPTTAWINVVVGTRDWCKLAYQFGHELGHVLCNSWESDAQPQNPCQWIEEALVEAFSLRSLALLADNWERAPPFRNDQEYAHAIRDYRDTLIARAREAAREQGAGDGLGTWFEAHETVLTEEGGINAARGAVSTMLDLLEDDMAVIEDLGALNRWPGRSGVPLPDYLALWEQSCAELGAPGRLPGKLGALLAAA
jgi:hypothetical protein